VRLSDRKFSTHAPLRGEHRPFPMTRPLFLMAMYFVLPVLGLQECLLQRVGLLQRARPTILALSTQRRGSLTLLQRAEHLTPGDTVRKPGEAYVEVRDAGCKGLGVFAGDTLPKNTWVGRYVGVLSTDEEIKRRYTAGSTTGDYIFKLTDELSLDAENSTHFSRFINHAQFGNLRVEQDVGDLNIDFFSNCDIARGDELTFDYGPEYWRFRPTPVSDSRNFSDPIYLDREPETSLIYPPPVGTKLPLIPLNTVELQATLALPEAECVTALLRCLDFFGSAPRASDGSLEVHFGVGGADAECLVLREDQGPPNLEDLQRAALACIVQSVLEPLDSSGKASAEFEAWVEATDIELGLLRRWREKVPRFVSARRDAAAAAAFLLWKNPNAHSVSQPLSRDACNALVAELSVEHEGALGYVIGKLALHAPEKHVNELVITLERWFYLGDGCTVISDDGVPALAGAVPQHLESIWKRIPRLVEAGLLRYR